MTPHSADAPPQAEQLPGMVLYREVVVDRPLGYRPLLLDLLTPPGQGPFPLLVHIYGGGFAGGSHKTDPLGGYLVERLVPEGFAVARVQYRHSKEAAFPAQIHDVKASVRRRRQLRR